MTNIPVIPSIRSILFFSLLLFFGNALATDMHVISNDGREVLLKEDGTWQYRSTNRYANTDDGRRVQLKEDGKWSYAGYAPLKSKTQVRTTDLDVKLKKVVIETFRKKIQKSSRIKTQTVFYLHLNNTQQEKTDIDINHDDIALIKVSDNNGKDYPVLSIKADISSLQYGKGITVLVRAEKSPALFDGVNAMNITLKAGIFGLHKPITLSGNTADFDKVDVDGF